MNLLLMGMNHRTAPLALREHYAIEDVAPALTKLVDRDVITEAVLLSTCNRVEAVACAPRLEVARGRLRSFFERDLAQGPPPDFGASLSDALYEHAGPEAVRHVFRVASSIDSMVLGEPQILGQVKEAYRAATAAGSCGGVLTRLFQHAFATAKRVRNETRIAERPVSVARVAAELASEIFESMADKCALLVGAGEMTELALETMRESGLSRMRIANRTFAPTWFAVAITIAAVAVFVQTALVCLISPTFTAAASAPRRRSPVSMRDMPVAKASPTPPSSGLMVTRRGLPTPWHTTGTRVLPSPATR